MKQFFPLLFLLATVLPGCDTEPVPVDDVPEFETTYPTPGQQQAHRILMDNDGILIIGTSVIGTQSSMMLMRTDFNGNLLWTRLIATSDNGEGHGLIRTSDGNLLLIGSQSSGNGKNILLVKTDMEGTVLWQRDFGGNLNDLGRDVIELSGGGFMLLATTSSFGAGVADMYVIRTDAQGEQLWARTFGGTNLDGGSELVQMDAYTIMLLGFTASFGAGDRDLWLQSVSVDGDSLWSSTYGGTNYEESQSIRRTADGGMVLCSHSASIDPVHAMHVLRLNAGGIILWEQHLGSPQTHDGGEGVIEDADGNFLFVGRSDSIGLGEQLYMVKTDAQGTILLEQHFGGEGDQWAMDVAESLTAHFIVGTSDIGGDMDVLLIKQPK